jgi:hypothetical protein
MSHTSHACYTSCPHQSPLFAHPNNIWWRLQIMNRFNGESLPLCCYFHPLRSKYSPKNPVLEHSVYIFSLCEKNEFNTTKRKALNNWYTPNFVVVWLNLLFRIREVPGSNLDPETGYHKVSWSSSVPPGECRDSALKLNHRFLPNLFHFIII